LVATLAPALHPSAVGAQADENGLLDATSYESPQFGYEVAWDDPWEADEEATTSEEGEADSLVLTSADTDGATLTVEGVATEDDPAAFLADRLDAVAEDLGADVEVVALPVEDGDVAAGTATFADGGDEVEVYYEVVTIEAGESLRLVELRAPAGELEAAAAAAVAVTVDGDPVFAGPLPVGDAASDEAEDDADSGDATPEDDEATPDEDDTTATPDAESATARADDEDPTEAVDEDATATAEAEEEKDATATAEAEEEAEDDATATAEAEADEEDADATATAEAEEDASALEGNTYTNAEYGYSVTFDEDVWEEGLEAAQENEFDFALFGLSQESLILFFAVEDFGGDPVECLEVVSESIEDRRGIDDVEPYEDETGEVVEGEEGDRAFAAFSYTFTDPETDEEFEQTEYVECRTVVEDEAVLILFHDVFDVRDYEDETEKLQDVLDGIETEVDPAQGDDEPAEEATAEPEDEETPEANEEETAAPDDEETPDADGEDADATATADAEEEDEETPVAEGAEVYESPTYGYTVAYDPEVWEAEDASQGGTDQLTLTDGPSQVFIEGREDYGGDAVACVNDQVATVRDSPGVTAVDPATDADGDRDAGGDATAFHAVYTVTATDGTFAGTAGLTLYFECRTIEEGTSVAIITHIVESDDYAAEAPKVEEILDTLELA
jgi:hypothetical protein